MAAPLREPTLTGAPAPTEAGTYPFWVEADYGRPEYLWRPNDCGKESSRNRLIVVFAGLGEDGVPNFQWQRTFLETPGFRDQSGLSFLFLRDTRLQWYIPNRHYYRELIEVARRLCKATELIFIGNSAGGFAALFFCAHFFINARVLVFSPQAFLGHEKRKKEGDERWAPYVNFLQKTVRQEFIEIEEQSDRLLTIPQRLLASAREHAQVEVHYNIRHYLDARHAAWLRRCRCVDGGDGESSQQCRIAWAHCVPHDGPTGEHAHALARELRDAGTLHMILHRFLEKIEPENCPGFTASNDAMMMYVNVGSVTRVPLFDLTCLRKASVTDKHRTRNVGKTAAMDGDDNRANMPLEVVDAVRHAMTNTGFFLVRPSDEEDESRDHSTSHVETQSQRVTKLHIDRCYAQAAALAALPQSVKETHLSVSAAARAVGLRGGWRRGETNLTACDSFRCGFGDDSDEDNDINNENDEDQKGEKSRGDSNHSSCSTHATQSPENRVRYLWPQKLKVDDKKEVNLLPRFRDDLLAYAAALSKDLVPLLCDLIGEALCLPKNWLRERCHPCTNRYSYLTLRHYRRQREAAPGDDFCEGERFGMRMHTDTEFITVLHVDSSGLEILDRHDHSCWHEIPPRTGSEQDQIPHGSFIVIFGDAFEILTNEKIRATYHRVRLPSAHAPKPRTSLVMFIALDGGYVEPPEAFGARNRSSKQLAGWWEQARKVSGAFL